MLIFFQQHPDFEKLEISSEPILSLPGIKVNLSQRKVISNGREIQLTVKEYDILCLLAVNRGRVLTYSQIYDKVWGDLPSGNEKDTISYHICNLRKKIASALVSIKSVREVGYRLS